MSHQPPQLVHQIWDRFTIEQRLNCKRGGLVGIRHDGTQQEWGHLCSLALFNACVTVEPPIFHGNDIWATQWETTRDGPLDAPLGMDSRDDVLAHGLWQGACGTSFDIHFCDLTACSYVSTKSTKVLEHPSKEKKHKYESTCFKRHCNFTPPAYSVEGIAVEDTRNAEQWLACLHAKKWNCTCFKIVNFFCVQMSLAMVRPNTLLIEREKDEITSADQGQSKEKRLISRRQTTWWHFT